MPDLVALITRALREQLAALGASEVDPAVERSARPEFGDWSSPAPLRAARVLRRPPQQIAAELRDRLTAAGVAYVRRWTTSGNGYVNAVLDETSWARAVIAEGEQRRHLDAIPLPEGYERVEGKTLIEHTNINTNKAAHVGHLRNACIGDAVARILRRTGHRVEVNNYIDDTGVQVADVVVGIRELGIPQLPGEPFDRYCSRVYVEVCRRYQSEPELLARRAATLRDIEARAEPVSSFTKDVARRVVQAHLATMRRFDIGYDLLTWESDILELGFWRLAFDLLRRKGAIVYVESGKNAGCWVMPWEPGEGDTDEEAKVLVKSDGVATYTAKDIAYQMWKFGVLGRDFHYRRWDPSDPSSPATTSAQPTEDELTEADFGRAQRAINVIDARQSYLQRVVYEALARLGFEEQSRRSVHLAYEVVALTPRAAAELGIPVEEGRSTVALSGRRGIEVRADDLLDLAVAKVAEKARDAEAARRLAAGAVRYYLLRFTLNQVIAFDFDEALRTTGDTGVYLQYAHARAAGILRKVPEEGEGPLPVPRQLLPCERELLHRIDAYPRALAEAVRTLSPAVLTDYAFSLASALSDVYEHTPPIVRESDAEGRRFRRALVAATRATLADALRTLGMDAPDRI